MAAKKYTSGAVTYAVCLLCSIFPACKPMGQSSVQGISNSDRSKAFTIVSVKPNLKMAPDAPTELKLVDCKNGGEYNGKIQTASFWTTIAEIAASGGQLYESPYEVGEPHLQTFVDGGLKPIPCSSVPSVRGLDSTGVYQLVHNASQFSDNPTPTQKDLDNYFLEQTIFLSFRGSYGPVNSQSSPKLLTLSVVLKIAPNEITDYLKKKDPMYNPCEPTVPASGASVPKWLTADVKRRFYSCDPMSGLPHDVKLANYRMNESMNYETARTDLVNAIRAAASGKTVGAANRAASLAMTGEEGEGAPSSDAGASGQTALPAVHVEMLPLPENKLQVRDLSNPNQPNIVVGTPEQGSGFMPGVPGSNAYGYASSQGGTPTNQFWQKNADGSSATMIGVSQNDTSGASGSWSFGYQANVANTTGGTDFVFNGPGGVKQSFPAQLDAKTGLLTFTPESANAVNQWMLDQANGPIDQAAFRRFQDSLANASQSGDEPLGLRAIMGGAQAQWTASQAASSTSADFIPLTPSKEFLDSKCVGSNPPYYCKKQTGPEALFHSQLYRIDNYDGAGSDKSKLVGDAAAAWFNQNPQGVIKLNKLGQPVVTQQAYQNSMIASLNSGTAISPANVTATGPDMLMSFFRRQLQAAEGLSPEQIAYAEKTNPAAVRQDACRWFNGVATAKVATYAIPSDIVAWCGQ